MGQLGMDEVVGGSSHEVGWAAPWVKVLDVDSSPRNDLLP